MLLFYIKNFINHPIRTCSVLKYQIKRREELKTFPKLINVILSCENYEQCKAAFFYLENYLSYFKLRRGQENFSVSTIIIMERLAMYLQDTMDHDKKSYHHAQMNGYKIQNTWPDLNDYLNGILPVQFKKQWTRNTSSIIPRELK